MFRKTRRSAGWRTLATGGAMAIALTLFATTASAQNNPFIIDGTTIPDAGVPTTDDPNGNAKELGPLNGSTTKIGVINTAGAPMLDFTNPNAQVDLDMVWLQTRKDLLNDDQWLYFAWARDSSNGSGFISIEFQQSGLPNGCVYAGVDFTDKNDPETIALIAACNPWRNRQNGDFIITWDQQGNTLNAFNDIKKRVFTCTGAAVPFSCTLGPTQDLGSVEAAVRSDRFRGEMAINLTQDVFGTAEDCLTFSNVLPGTVTGNSDTADYKDTVFATFPPITNCGVMTVSKRLVDPAGNLWADATTEFSYTVKRTGTPTDPLRFAADAANYPLDTTTEITRPSVLGATAPGIKGGQTNTHPDLIAGANYTIVENNATLGGFVTGTPYKLLSIVCYDGSVAAGASSTLSSALTASATAVNVASGAGFLVGDYILVDSEKMIVVAKPSANVLTVQRGQLGSTAAAHANGAAVDDFRPKVLNNTTSTTFQIVVPNGIDQTDCLITNQLSVASPSATTGQSVRLHDSVSITGIQPGAGDKDDTVDFKLYSDNTCTTQVGSTITATLTYGGGGTTATANTFASSGITVSLTEDTAATFYWRVFRDADLLNNAIATACGDETTTITISDQ